MNNLNQYSVLVIVPAYNAAEHLPQLLARLKTYVCPTNLLVIDDGSTDESLDILKQEEVRHIAMGYNQGKGAALAVGFRYAMAKGYRSVLTLDADLQHLPEEIPRFYAVDNGHRLVLGTRRFVLSAMPPGRWLSNNLTSLIVSVFSTGRVRDSQSGFRLIPTSLLRTIKLQSDKYDLESELLFKAGAVGCEIVEVPITMVYDRATSHIRPVKDTLRFVRQVWRRIFI